MTDQLQRVVEFNEIAGNESKVRDLNDPLVRLYVSLVEEEFNEIFDALHENDRVGVLDGAGDLIVVAAGLIAMMGYNPVEILKEINDSNFSKYCTSEEEAVESVESYSDDPRYIEVCYKQVGDYFVILGKKVGHGGSGFKILKGVNYREPAL